jgi:hypothetical protein
MAARQLIPGIATAGLLIASAAAVKIVERAGMLGGDAAIRAAQVMFGLIVAYTGNQMPKRVGEWRSQAAEGRIQSALRVGGWSFALAGLGYAAAWMIAPAALAGTVSTAMLAAATALTAGYAVWCYAACAAGASPSAADRN